MNHTKLFGLFLVFIFIPSTHAVSAEEKQAAPTAAHQTTFTEHYRLAEQGDANAQNKVALSYVNGEGVAQDLAKAFTWFEKAANQNHPEAQFYYARFILNGQFTEKSPDKALLWFKKAADQGYANAQNSMGTLYMVGLGTKIDYKESFKWLKKAAEAGNAEAMYNLAQLYEKGTGVDQNSKHAVFWYEQSAKQGFAYSEFELGVAHALGLGGYQKNEVKAMEWYEKAAKKGLGVAQSNLADMYLARSELNDKNIYQAVLLYKNAAEQGVPRAQMALGVAYFNGEGIARDKLLGLEWLSKPSKNGYEPAKKELADIRQHHEKGLEALTAQYKREISTWSEITVSQLEASAKKGNPLSQTHLAIAHQFGLLWLPKNPQLAVDWYLKRMGADAVEYDQPTQTNLGLIYIGGLHDAALQQATDALQAKLAIDKRAEHGDLAAIKFLARFYNRYGGGYGSLKQAKHWYEKAANAGDVGAQLALARLYTTTAPNEAGVDAQSDHAKALYWYKKVVVYDKPYAQYELAKLYIDGRGGEKNPAEAMRLLKKAADKHIDKAQLELANIYKAGVITTQDYPKALALYKQLATADYVKYGNNYLEFYSNAMPVADIYENGLGVPVDKLQAFVWYSLVSEYSKRKLFAAPDPNNLPKGMPIGVLTAVNDHNPEEDRPTGSFITGGTAIAEKHKQTEVNNRLTALEKNMTLEDINNAKKALQQWKFQHQHKPVSTL